MGKKTPPDRSTRSPRKSRVSLARSEASSTTRRSFDLARDSIYVADPITELRICGGRGVLPREESGDLDTPPGPDLRVADQRRLEQAILPQTLTSVDRVGVIEPVVIARIDDVPTVIAGKGRVRAARRSNRLRVEDGRPLIKVKCVTQRDVSAQAIMATLIAENNLRTEDTLADRVEKLRAFLSCGGAEVDAAVHFGVTQSTIRDWLTFDDHATDQVKTAAREGKVSASTAAELARIRDPDRQRAALGQVLGRSGKKQRSARAVRAIARGETQPDRATDRRSQLLLLTHLSDDQDSRWSGEDSEYWRGVVDALRLVTGTETTAVEGDLVQALGAARGTATTEEEVG